MAPSRSLEVLGNATLAKLYRLLAASPRQLPFADELSRKLFAGEVPGGSLAAVRSVLDAVDATPPDEVTLETSRMIDRCFRRLRESNDMGDRDFDRSSTPHSHVLPIHTWAGKDGSPEWVLPPTWDRSSSMMKRRILYLHGGGYCSCHPSDPYRPMSTRLAAVTGLPVLALDYRLAPENPYPAALEDALSALSWLRRHGPRTIEHAARSSDGIPSEFEPSQADAVYIVGDSAGSGLALATIAALGHGELAPGVPLPGAGTEDEPQRPAALALMSPWLDLTCSAPSYATRAWDEASYTGDPIFSHGDPEAERARRRYERAPRYSALADPTDSRLSPLFMPPELIRSMLPPTLIVVGDSEVHGRSDSNQRVVGLEPEVRNARAVYCGCFRSAAPLLPLYTMAPAQHGLSVDWHDHISAQLSQALLGDSTEFVARAVEAGAEPKVRLRIYRRMWHNFPGYTEACGQEEAYHLDEQAVADHHADRSGLPHAWMGYADIRDWLEQHPS